MLLYQGLLLIITSIMKQSAETKKKKYLLFKFLQFVKIQLEQASNVMVGQNYQIE